MKKIGVFDSGIGGKSVANAIEKAMPEVEVVFLSDPEHLPYGTKTPDELKELVRPKILELVASGAEVIVIACNTVSTTIIDWIRELVNVPVIGVEPMLEEASKLSRSKVITVCATPTTLGSKRYHDLKQQYAEGATVIEPDCSRWTRMIEDNQVDREEIFERIDSACQKGADVIVLGCTHYHWIEELISQIANGRAEVIHPEAKVIEQVRAILNT